MSIETSAHAGPSLAELLNFTHEDLAANRNGQVTPAQQQRLEQEQQSSRGLFVAAAVLFLAVAVVAFLVDLVEAALLFSVLGGGLLVAFYWSLRRQSRKLNNLQVECRSGKLALTRATRRATGSPRRTYHYTLTVEGVQLPIDKPLYDALEQAQARGDGNCTVYYLPYFSERKILLSLEPGLVRTNGSAEGRTRGAEGASEIWRAINILEGRAAAGDTPAKTATEATAAEATAAEAATEVEARQPAGQQLEAARATLLQAGAHAVPYLDGLLYRPLYRQLVAEMGLPAIEPLMRLVASDPAVIESPLINHVVATILAISDEKRYAAVLAYFEPQHPPSVRMAALRVITSRRNPRRVRILQSAATDPEPAIAAYAQQTLARLDHLHGRF